MHTDISANININNHRMNTRRVNPFACPQAGRIGNNVREPIHVAENNKVRPSCATWKSFLTYFRHGSATRFRLSPGERTANLIQDYFPPTRCTVVARSTVFGLLSQLLSSENRVEPYFQHAAPPGRARTNLIRNYVLICGVSAVHRFNDRTFRASIGLAPVNSGEHEF